MIIRPAVPADAWAVAGVHVRSWQVGYQGLMPDDYLASLRPEDRAGRYTFGIDEPDAYYTLVGLSGDAVVGFATTRAPAGGAGELNALYVDPPAWDTGAGRALVAAARDRLAGLGCEVATLWVLAGNRRALRFYDRDGWRETGDVRRDEVWGVEVDELRMDRALP